MRNRWTILMALSACGGDPAPSSSPRAQAPELSVGEQDSSDAGGCSAEQAAKFYWRTTRITYDYQPVSADELMRLSSLVVRGRVLSIGPSVPQPQQHAGDIETALEVEVSHTYHGTTYENERLYAVMPRGESVTVDDLAASSRMIPDAEVTLFLQASDSVPAQRKQDARVLAIANPQSLLVASSCGVASALGGSPFAENPANATELHAAMLKLRGDPCRSQCPLATLDESCTEQPFESFAKLDETRVDWKTHRCKADARPDDDFPFVVEASCEDGKRVLYSGTGLSIERRYYDSEGAFLGLETAGDGGQGPSCHGSAYWPERVACPQATITRVECGHGSFKVGERIQVQ